MRKGGHLTAPNVLISHGGPSNGEDDQETQQRAVGDRGAEAAADAVLSGEQS